MFEWTNEIRIYCKYKKSCSLSHKPKTRHHEMDLGFSVGTVLFPKWRATWLLTIKVSIVYWLLCFSILKLTVFYLFAEIRLESVTKTLVNTSSCDERICLMVLRNPHSIKHHCSKLENTASSREPKVITDFISWELTAWILITT